MDAQPDLLYFHSSLDPFFTIMPLVLRRLGLIPKKIPVLVAPRGELSAGARSIKQLKKTTFLLVAKALGLYRNVTWHATAKEEAQEIRALWGANAPVQIAPNLPSKMGAKTELHRQAKQTNALRLVFLSRISRKKNLHGALEILRGVKARVQFDIYGGLEDPRYWDECDRLIRKLPSNVAASYKGVVSPDDVIPILSGYDAFLLPTLGENFGHVILEALLAGCPVLLSDQTPWRDLPASHAGFDLPLNDPSRFVQAIEEFAAMDSARFGVWSAGARDSGLRYSNNPGLVAQTRRLLATALGNRPMQTGNG
jgi:glycosyltransferase involved in cell wall biosynthesis